MKLFVFAFILIATFKGWANTQPFRLHITKEPTSYDSGFDTTNGFVLQNIHGRLFRWTASSGLVGELAKSCSWKKTEFVCKLAPSKWSNGEAITPEQIRDSFRRLVHSNKSPYSFLLQNLNSIDDIQIKKDQLIFKLTKKEPQFAFKLSHPGLAVIHPKFDTQKPESNVYSGAYFINKVNPNKSILLKPNPFYFEPAKLEIEFLVLQDDATANSLYEQNRLDFLRRVPAAFIPSLKDKNDFYMLPTYRLDHFALSGASLQNEKLRKSLVESLDYQELQKLLSAPQPIGCPGISKDWTNKVLCHKQILPISKWPGDTPSITLTFNAAGGDDHRRVAEWMQAQWSKTLGIQVQVRSLENKIFLQDLKSQKLQIYRRGVSPDIATCWAAVEAFHSKSENFVFQDLGSGLDSLIEKLELADSKKQSQNYCTQIIERLMSSYRIIPTGQIYWAMRASPKFKGWIFNELGELDLRQLRLAK